MAINLGGGQFVDTRVDATPRADLIYGRERNLARGRDQIIKEIEEIKQWGASKGFDPAHLAEAAPQLAQLFGALTGSPERGQEMYDGMANLPVTQAAEDRYRHALKATATQPYQDFQPGSRDISPDAVDPENPLLEEILAEYDEQGRPIYRKDDPMVNQNYFAPPSAYIPEVGGGGQGYRPTVDNSLIERAMGRPVMANGGSVDRAPGTPEPSVRAGDIFGGLVVDGNDFSRADRKRIKKSGQAIRAQRRLDDYEAKTGDLHLPALVGTDEFIVNKDAAEMFGPILELINNAFPNKDAKNLPDSLPLNAKGGTPIYAPGGWADSLPQERNAQRTEHYGGGAVREEMAQAENARKEMERNAASDVDSGTWERIPATLLKTEFGQWQVNPQAGIEDEGGNKFVYARRLPAQAEPQPDIGPSQNVAYQRTSQPGMVDMQRSLDPEFKMGVSPRDQQPSDQAPTATLGPITAGTPAPVSPPVGPTPPAPVPDPVPDPVVEDDLPEGTTPENKEVIRQLVDRGYFAQMDEYNQRIARVSPSSAQNIPEAKYWADKFAEADLSTLDAQKTAATIQKLQAEAYRAMQQGDTELFKQKELEMEAEFIIPKAEAYLAKTWAGVDADRALAMLRGGQLEMQGLTAMDILSQIGERQHGMDTKFTDSQQAQIDALTALVEPTIEMNRYEQKRYWRDKGPVYQSLMDGFAIDGILPSTYQTARGNFPGFTGGATTVPMNAEESGVAENEMTPDEFVAAETERMNQGG